MTRTNQHAAEELLETAIEAARGGGRELLAWRGRFSIREKGRTDFVTDADMASQKVIERILHERFPGHHFIGEETASHDFAPSAEAYAWIVDPLDGTTNYLHDYPHYAVSVAVAQNGRPIAGAIYDPVADRCFSAAAGRGAWLNGEKLATSAASTAAAALVAVSLPAHVHRDSRDLADFIEAVQVCQGVRRSGSAALNLAYVAAGAIDAFWATHIHAWDVAAGVLLVREAGGVVRGRDGGEFNLWRPHFIAAATEPLIDDLLQVLTPAGAK